MATKNHHIGPGKRHEVTLEFKAVHKSGGLLLQGITLASPLDELAIRTVVDPDKFSMSPARVIAVTDIDSQGEVSAH